MEKYMKVVLKHPPCTECDIIMAYYRVVLPDFKTPDGLRFDTIRAHFWEYYDPNKPEFAFITVLIDKLEEWVFLHHHNKDSMAGLYLEKKDIIDAINSYIARIDRNPQNQSLALRYALNKLDRYEDKLYFLEVYDKWILPEG